MCVCGHFNYVNAALRLGESSIIQWAGPESERGAIWKPFAKVMLYNLLQKSYANSTDGPISHYRTPG